MVEPDTSATIQNQLQQALAASRAGRTAEAEAVCHAVLAIAPDHGAALGLLGALQLQAGQFATAAKTLSATLARHGPSLDLLLNLGRAQYGAGDYKAAIETLNNAVAIDPTVAPGRNSLGMALLAGGDTAAAIVAFEQAYALDQNYVGALYNLAVARRQNGDLKGAALDFAKVVERQPTFVAAVAGLAGVQAEMGHVDQAIATYGRALELAPDDIVALNNLAGLLLGQNRVTDALAISERAHAAAPDNPQILVTHGNCLRRDGQPAEARAVYRKALELDAKLLEARVNLAHILRAQDSWLEAIDEYERALTDGLKPAEGYTYIGGVFSDVGITGSAITMYEAAIQAAELAGSDPHPIRIELAILLLANGMFKRGWTEFEHRFESRKPDHTRRPPEPPPFWRGENLSGKTIIVHAEQGLGDQILFSSMLPDLVARAGKVYFRCRPRLASVFARSFPNIELIPPDFQHVRPELLGQAHYQLMMASAGQFLRPDFQSIPSRPGFLKADPGKVAVLRSRYVALAAGRRIVGLSWRSQNNRVGMSKSATLSDWIAILKTPGVWFVNLQYGDCTADLAAVSATLGVDIYQDPKIDVAGDLDDYFAQVAAMDLVVSTSNTAVHVAGSLNVPCWVVLPRGLGLMWYWFRCRNDSPWYPSLKLYRQPDGDENSEGAGSDDSVTVWWRHAVQQIGNDLVAWRDAS